LASEKWLRGKGKPREDTYLASILITCDARLTHSITNISKDEHKIPRQIQPRLKLTQQIIIMSESDLPVAYASPIGEVAVNSSAVATGEESWACPQCTLVNSAQSGVCLACNNSRPITIQEEMRWVDEANRKQIMADDNGNYYDSTDGEDYDEEVKVEEIIEGETPFERKLRRKERRRHRMMAGAALGAAVGVGAGVAGVAFGAAAAAAGINVISKKREKKKDERVARERAIQDAHVKQMS